LGPTAWELMNPSGRSHLTVLLDKEAAVVSFSCPRGRFQPTAADAYCYYVSLGPTQSVSALRTMVLLEENQSLESRMKTSYEQLMKAVGKNWRAWELGSLEAFLLSPLFGPRGKLVRMSQAKKAKAQVPSTESPSPTLTPVLDPPAVVAVAAASTPTLHPAAAATAAHDDAEQQRFGSLLATELQAALPAPSASSSNTAKGAAAAEEECSDKLAVSSTSNEILDLTQDEFLMLLDDLRVQPWGCSAASSSSLQAVGVMRTFLLAEYPDKREGVDYRVPSDARFREWRRYLEPICHYLSVSVIAIADRTHIMHDATTKHHIHIIQSVYRCEFHNDDGTTTVLDVPMRFDVCPSGVAKAEAAQLKSHMRSNVGGGVAASFANMSSSTSDNAARATNDELAALA
jgi:hypothetical protein